MVILSDHEIKRQAAELAELKRNAIFAVAKDIGTHIPETSPVDLWPLFLCRGLLKRVIALEEELRAHQEET